MPNIDVVDQTNTKVGALELNDEVFAIRPHVSVMHQVVRAHRAKARAGTASTLTRSEVNYSGIKPYRQKGTGRARAGFRGSPLWRGGGVIFGPKPRKYNLDLPKKVRQLALKSALSSKMAEGKIKVVERLELAAPKTRELLRILKQLDLTGKTLIVIGDANPSVQLSARNVQDVEILEAGRVNTYDLLNTDSVLFTRDAVEKILEALSA